MTVPGKKRRFDIKTRDVFVGAIVLCLVFTYNYISSWSKSNREMLNEVSEIKKDTEIIKNISDTLGRKLEGMPAVLVEAKFSNINQRFEDLYRLGPIIITLLLALIAGVYLRSQNQVEQFLSDNFDDYNKEITSKLEDATKMVSQMKMEHDTFQALKNQMGVKPQVDTSDTGPASNQNAGGKEL